MFLLEIGLAAFLSSCRENTEGTDSATSIIEFHVETRSDVFIR